MKPAGAARTAGLLVGLVTASLLAAGATALVLLAARHPEVMPVHRVVALLYTVPLAVAFAVISVAVLRRLPRHPIGWLFGLLSVVASFAVFMNGYVEWDLPGATWMVWSWVVVSAAVFFGLAMALLLFRTGRPASRRWGWLARLLWLYLGLSMLTGAVAPWPTQNDLVGAPVSTELGGVKANPIGVSGQDWLAAANSVVPTLGVLLLVAALSSLLPRWRHSTGDERQQIKWLALAGLLFAVELTLGLIGALTDMSDDTAWAGLAGGAVFTLALTAIPVAIGLGIVRYRLYHLDRLISRAVVYGTLAVLIASAYLMGVVLAGDLASRWAGSSTVLALAATAAAAVAFQPLRAKLEARADRWVYGPRAAPYELMTRFGHDLGQALATDEVLARIAQTAGQAMRARAARVATTLPDGTELAGSWGPSAAEFDTVVPVQHDGDTIAEIFVAGADARTGDQALLRHTASVSAGALHNLRLLADLEGLNARIQQQNAEIAASRARLIAAAHVERRRVARLVSDQLGPDLRALRQALPTVCHMVESRPEKAAVECRRLSRRATQLVDAMRALSRGVLPTLLVDHGLAAALRAMLRRLDGPVTLDISPSLEGVRLPASIETTLYLCCRAAVRPLTTPGRAASTSLRVWRDNGSVAFSVTHETHRLWDDDLGALHDRVVALGGALSVEPNGPPGPWSTLTGTVPVGP